MTSWVRSIERNGGVLSPPHNHFNVECLLSFGKYESKRWYLKNKHRELSESYEPPKDRFHVLKTVSMIWKVRDDTCAMLPPSPIFQLNEYELSSSIEEGKKLDL